jgi:hypothetical protein
MKEIAVPPASWELDQALARSAHWAKRIAEAWQSSVANIVETGRLLIQARTALSHGEWLPMIETDLPFSPRTAQMLMKIAEHPGITNAKHVSLLPPSWGTLHALTKLPSDEFERRIADGRIRPDLERKEIKAWKPVTKVQAACPQTKSAAPLTLSDRVEVVTKQPQPTHRDRFAVSDEESFRAGHESVTPTLPTQFAAAMALPEMTEDPVRESASADIPLALRGCEASKMSDGIGKEAAPAPALDPQAWTMSTAQEREAFVTAVGRSEIEDAFNAIESGCTLSRGLNTLNQAWNAATESDRRAFYRQHFPANVMNRYQT